MPLGQGIGIASLAWPHCCCGGRLDTFVWIFDEQSKQLGYRPSDTARLAGSQRVGIIGLPAMWVRTRRFCVFKLTYNGTGKSTCCMSLLVELRMNFPVINVFSGSIQALSLASNRATLRLSFESDNPFYSLCIPKLFINAKVSKRGLKQFINRQRLALKFNSPLKDALLILDDCFDHPGVLDNNQRIFHPQASLTLI